MEKWISHLAQQEIKRVNFDSIDIEETIPLESSMNETTLCYLSELYSHFIRYINEFNNIRETESPLQKIKIYKITDTEGDFVIFRNGLKLLLTKKSFHSIAIQYLDQDKKLESYHEILLKIGTFEELQWCYQGQTFQQESFVRYYLSDFIRKSSIL